MEPWMEEHLRGVRTNLADMRRGLALIEAGLGVYTNGRNTSEQTAQMLQGHIKAMEDLLAKYDPEGLTVEKSGESSPGSLVWLTYTIGKDNRAYDILTFASEEAARAEARGSGRHVACWVMTAADAARLSDGY